MNYTTANGTATTTAPADYGAKINKTLTIAAGATGGSIKVTVNGDRRVEPDENFTVTLSTPVNIALGRSVATGTIINDDAAATPRVSVGDESVVEGNTGTQTATFDVTLDQPAASAVTVPWSTADGTGTAAADYTAASGTLSFPAGTTTKTVSVVVKGDTLVESNETATINLGTPTGAVVGRGNRHVDDHRRRHDAVDDRDLDRRRSRFRGQRGHAQRDLQRAAGASGGRNRDRAVRDHGRDRTATTDYTTKTGTLSIPAGSLSGQIKIPVVADGLTESNETFNLTLSSPTGGATLGRSVGTGTIIDDDP